jgi:phosphoglycolate phosphatase
MDQKNILFDLDGTLTDSGEGIMNCAEYALNHLGIAVPNRDALRAFVGPPLDMMFARFDVPVDQIDEAIRIYRSRCPHSSN